MACVTGSSLKSCRLPHMEGRPDLVFHKDLPHVRTFHFNDEETKPDVPSFTDPRIP